MLKTTLAERPNRRTGAKLAVLLAVPLFVGVLSACSAGTEPDKPDSSGKGVSTEQTFEDWQLKFASCMRGEGIDMPDPSDEGTQALTLDESGAGAFQTASEKCIDELGDPPVPPGGQMSEEEFLESQLKMAKCFRENGLDVQDPKKGQGFTIPEGVSDEILAECGLGSSSGGAVSIAPAG